MEKSIKEIIIKKYNRCSTTSEAETKGRSRAREKTRRRKPCTIVYGRKYPYSCINALAGVDHLSISIYLYTHTHTHTHMKKREKGGWYSLVLTERAEDDDKSSFLFFLVYNICCILLWFFFYIRFSRKNRKMYLNGL